MAGVGTSLTLHDGNLSLFRHEMSRVVCNRSDSFLPVNVRHAKSLSRNFPSRRRTVSSSIQHTKSLKSSRSVTRRYSISPAVHIRHQVSVRGVMVTPREVIDALIQQFGSRTKISLIKDWYPEIERARQAGVRYSAIQHALAEHGIPLTEAHLRKAVYSLRKKARGKIPIEAKSAPMSATPATPEIQTRKPQPPLPSIRVMTPSTGVPTPESFPSTPAEKFTMEQLIAMLPPRPMNNQVEIDHPIPDTLPPGVNFDLLKRVMKMDGFNSSWPNDISLNLIMALPEVLPDHLNPIAEIGGVRCDFRLGRPVEFGSASDGMGVKRGDDRWDKILSDEQLRKKWRDAHNRIRHDYNDWLKGRIGLPID